MRKKDHQVVSDQSK